MGLISFLKNLFPEKPPKTIFDSRALKNIALGMSKEEVKEIIGEPTYDYVKKWYYYDNEELQKMEALPFDQLGEFKHKFIAIDFDDSDKVCQVLFDSRHKPKFGDAFWYCCHSYENCSSDCKGEYCSTAETETCGKFSGEISPPFEGYRGTYWSHNTHRNVLHTIPYKVFFSDRSYLMSVTTEYDVSSKNWLSKICDAPIYLTGVKMILEQVNENFDFISINDSLWCIRTAEKNFELPSYFKSIACNAFSTCSNTLKSIKIPDSVAVVQDDSFKGCEVLSRVSIPDSIRFINGNAFAGCTALEYNYDEGSRYLGNENNPYVLLVSSADGKINDKTRIISSLAFKPELKLENIIIPSNVFSIGEGSFQKHTTLKSISLSTGIEAIHSNAFQNCGCLTNIVLSDTLKYIGERIFEGCSSLPEVSIPKEIKHIKPASFRNCINLKTVNLPEGLISIDNFAFENCQSLESISIGENVNTIGNRAFFDCKSLKEIKIGKNVISIGESAFSGCMSVEKIFIPKTVRFIDDNAFACSNDKTVIYCESDTKPYGWKNWNPNKCRVVWGYTGE